MQLASEAELRKNMCTPGRDREIIHIEVLGQTELKNLSSRARLQS